MPGLSVRRELHLNSRPALLVCGRFETGFQPHREFAEEKMPHLTVRETDTGHAVNMQGADIFNAAIETFVQSTS